VVVRLDAFVVCAISCSSCRVSSHRRQRHRCRASSILTDRRWLVSPGRCARSAASSRSPVRAPRPSGTATTVTVPPCRRRAAALQSRFATDRPPEVALAGFPPDSGRSPTAARAPLRAHDGAASDTGSPTLRLEQRECPRRHAVAQSPVERVVADPQHDAEHPVLRRSRRAHLRHVNSVSPRTRATMRT